MIVRLLTDVDRLNRLLSDLKRLHKGDFRSIDLGSDAPILNDHRMSARRTPCLEGEVYGHPILPDGRIIFTSELHALLEHDGQLHARTLNRWYRLQTPTNPRYEA